LWSEGASKKARGCKLWVYVVKMRERAPEIDVESDVTC